MPRFTREQVRRRQRTALVGLVVIVLVLVGSCTAFVRSLGGDDEEAGARSAARNASADDADARTADHDAMELAATVEDAAAREQLPSDVTLAEDEVMGIDVSVHQGQVDWPQVADAGYSFAYIKATEGVDYVDPQFTANWRGVHQAGMTRGAYHYFTLCSSGADQAADFLKTVPVDDTALPPALDLEFDGACDERPEADDAQGEIDAFVSAVEAAWGRRVVVYSSSEWRMHYGLPVAEERPDWLFSDSGRPGQGDWAVWQLRFDGTVPGITKKVDVDVARPEILRETARL